MISSRRLLSLLLLAASPLAAAPASSPLVPYYKYTQTLLASTECQGGQYIMVPICLRLDEHDLLVGYKRGYAHFRESQAGFELMRIDPVSQRIDPARTMLSLPGVVFEDGEFVRFTNGEIACYIDVQKGSSDAVRLGLEEYRSRDGGRSFQDRGKLGLIDGVEYGYGFASVTRGATTWMLAMRFSNLAGGNAVFSHHAAGSVDVVRSEDNGRSWHFVRNLTEEFHGHPINESSFAPWGPGYIVITRGYDNRTYLQTTDADFHLRRQVDLDAACPGINSYIGRPRVFQHDGAFYFMGRNQTEKGAMPSPLGHGQPTARSPNNHPMDLSLFRFDPATLAVTKHVILDNAEAENVIDGYYGVPYWQAREGRTYFNVITHKRSYSRLPDLIRLEFDWDEVR